MNKGPLYSGNRNPKFVAVSQGGTLQNADHRLLAAWAAVCAQHVLPLFTAQYPQEYRPAFAISQAQAWARGEISMMQAREAAFAAHDSARIATGAAREAARAAGHAVATAHMADHELGAAAYAIRAVRAAASPEEREATGLAECRWQRDQLPTAIRDLVLEDEQLRNKKFWSLFE